jgi:ATP-binding cassette subfamily F protein uup
MNLITIENLSKQFSERLLFDRANLLINEGDRIGLIGVNGSGKSTLLRIVAGLEAPDTGSVSSPGGMRTEFLTQEPALDDGLTVLQTIFRSDSPQMRLLAAYEGVSSRLQHAPGDAALQQQLMDLGAELDHSGGWAAEANAKAVLTQLGVTDFDARIGTLSGGQRKRVALARALIDRADLLILDEPTNHIDAETVAWLEEYLAATPGALLMVTHDRYFLDRVVNRIVELDRRQLVAYRQLLQVPGIKGGAPRGWPKQKRSASQHAQARAWSGCAASRWRAAPSRRRASSGWRRCCRSLRQRRRARGDGPGHAAAGQQGAGCQSAPQRL